MINDTNVFILDGNHRLKAFEKYNNMFLNAQINKLRVLLYKGSLSVDKKLAAIGLNEVEFSENKRTSSKKWYA